MRLLPLLLLGLAACTNLSSEQKRDLAFLQRNASGYYERGDFARTLGLVDRALEIDPVDYKMRAMKGATLLRLSGPASGNDHRQLDAAREVLGALFTERRVSRHETFVLFFYALARQKQGFRLLAEASTTSADPANSADATTAADAEFAASTELLTALIERGELLRYCHKHLMQTAVARNDTATVLREGEAYLAACAAEQNATKGRIDNTLVVAFENEQRGNLEQLRAEETEVRRLLAAELFRQKRYADAVAHLDALLKIDPTRSDDHYNRGLMLEELGRVEEAKTDLRTFLATTVLPKDHPKVQSAVQMLTRAR